MSLSYLNNGPISDSPDTPRLQVVEHYSGYKPPFDVTRLVARMLDSIPPKYLNGLSEIVLTNPAGLSRHRRRSVTKARGRKVRIAEARGLYHPAWNGKPAWIEIFVDKTLLGWEKGWWLKFPCLQEMTIGEVLFHEVGHHIHFTIKPEFMEKEDVADDWGKRLRRHQFAKQHPVLRRIFRVFRPCLRWFYVLNSQGLLKKGLMSRSEYENTLKGFCEPQK
jgi:hypothetical protein